MFAFFADASNVLSYITFVIMAIIIYQYPEIKLRVDKLLVKYFLDEKFRNKNYKEPQIEKIE